MLLQVLSKVSPQSFNLQHVVQTLKKIMQGEDDLRGLAKIMAFMRALSILLVLMHLYWFCYGFFLQRGWTLEREVW